MKINKIFLLVTLSLILIGFSYASEVSNDTRVTGTDTGIEKSIDTDHNVADTIVKKEFKKEDEIRTVKSDAMSYYVKNYSSLHEALTTNTYDTVTVNLQSDINLSGNTSVNTAINDITINANGYSIDGKSLYQFLTISNSTNVTINDITITNCVGEYGGAIDNNGVLSVKDSTLNFNTAKYNGGAIFSRYNTTVTIINSTFYNNTGEYNYGGAIYSNGNLEITESTFYNNTATDDAGAIYNAGNMNVTNSEFHDNFAVEGAGAINNEGDLYVENSNFYRNIAQYGAAIYNFRNTIIKNTTFIDNRAVKQYSTGGAIYTYGRTNITNCSFNNNRAEDYGGAIDNCGKLYINNSVLYNNKAVSENAMGGAISNRYWSTLTIENNTLENNTAKSGGAVCNIYSTMTINNNTFKNNSGNVGSAIFNHGENSVINANNFIKNKAKVTGEAIVDNGTNTIISNNLRADISLDSSTIFINESSNTNVTNNIFDDGRKSLIIIINPIQNVTYGHNVTISGIFMDDDENIRANSALKIFINKKSISTRTDSNGLFNITSKVGMVGTNNVTASHSGDSNYYPTNTTATFIMLKQDLIITVDPISTIQYGNNVTITGTFMDKDGNARSNNEVNININGKTESAKTDTEGKYTFISNIGKLGENNVTISHSGGANYNPTSVNTTFTVTKQDLIITLNNIGTVTYGPVTITGKLTDALGNLRVNTGVKLVINGKSATAKTNSKGEFSFTTKVGKVGINNVTASHNGGGNFNPTTTNMTFTMVKQDLIVNVDPIYSVVYGDSVVIKGSLTDATGKIRSNSNLKVIINGKTLTTKTDGEGKFTATSKVGIVGVNNVTVAHSGGTGFNPTSTSTTFTMIKQNLTISVDAIGSIKKGSTFTVTGLFTDAKGKARANTNLKVKFNQKEDSVKTDANGMFAYTTTANNIGTNSITVSHNGGANYNPCSTTVKFNVYD